LRLQSAFATPFGQFYSGGVLFFLNCYFALKSLREKSRKPVGFFLRNVHNRPNKKISPQVNSLMKKWK